MTIDQSYASYQAISKQIEDAIADSMEETIHMPDDLRVKFIHQRVMDVVDSIVEEKLAVE